MNNQKRVCIVNIKEIRESNDPEAEVFKPGDRVMRVTASYAKRLVEEGTWAYTTKSKLKSYINKQIRLMKNGRTLEFIQNITGESYGEFNFNGKRAVSVPTFKVVPKGGSTVAITRPRHIEIEDSLPWPKSKNNVTTSMRLVKHTIVTTKSVHVKKRAKDISKEVVLRHTGNKILITQF